MSSGVTVKVPVVGSVEANLAIEDCTLGMLVDFASNAVERDRLGAALLAFHLRMLAETLEAKVKAARPAEPTNFPP